MQLFIKNMVCNRCIKVVQEEFLKLGLQINHIKLGVVDIFNDANSIDLPALAKILQDNGFDLLDDKRKQFIEKIKNVVIDTIHHHDQVIVPVNYSLLLQEKVGKDYQFLSNLFSSTEGITIEKYIISQKIERVKELLIYNELNLSEIAYKMGYSSVQHLSSQFRKNTGLTPSEFKKLNNHNRRPLDEVGQ